MKAIATGGWLPKWGEEPLSAIEIFHSGDQRYLLETKSIGKGEKVIDFIENVSAKSKERIIGTNHEVLTGILENIIHSEKEQGMRGEHRKGDHR